MKRFFMKKVAISIVVLSLLFNLFMLAGCSEKGRVEVAADENIVYQPNIKHISKDDKSNVMFMDNIIILFSTDEASENDVQSAVDSIKGKIVGKLPEVHQYQVQVEERSLAELNSACADLMKYDCIDYATYDAVTANSDQSVPNDPWTDKSSSEAEDWNELNPSGNNWWAEAVSALSAWDYNKNMTKISVGVIDSGFDNEHVELKNKIKFTSSFNDKREHGTLICGIIGAEANNGEGINGLLQNVDLLTWNMCLTDEQKEAIKILDNEWTTDTQVYSGLVTLVQKGAKVINFSQGKARTDDTSEDFIRREGEMASKYMYELLSQKKDKYSSENKYDFVVVCAAGNGNSEYVSVDAKYTGAFTSINYNNCKHDRNVSAKDIIDRIIVVGAAKNDGDNKYTQVNYSNAGDRVDICAPGYNIFSTTLDNKYALRDGTSLAAPIVSGVCGMVWAVNPFLDGSQVKQIVCARENTYYDVYDNTEDSHPLKNNYRMVNALLSVEAALNYGSEKPLSTYQENSTEPSDSYTAMDLIDKSLSEITGLMGDYTIEKKKDYSPGFGTGGGVIYLLNEETMPGIAVAPAYSSGIYADYKNGVDIREKIKNDSYYLDGIAVYGNGKLNENISADMTYKELAAEIGDFGTHGAAQALCYSTEIDGYKIGFWFPADSGLVSRAKNGKVSSEDMKKYNPKLSSIAVFTNDSSQKATTAKATTTPSTSSKTSSKTSSEPSLSDLVKSARLSEAQAYRYEYPKILLDSSDAKRVNSEIESKYDPYFEKVSDNMQGGTSEISYKADKSQGILSVCIKRHTGMETDYDVYNFDISTGSLLTNREFCEKTGTDYDNVNERVIQGIKDYYKQFNSNTSKEWIENLMNKSLEEDNLAYTKIFFSNGKIKVLYRVKAMAGAEYYYQELED